MTINISQLFAPAVLTGSAVTYYTVPAAPASNTLINGRVRFSNTTTGVVTVTAYAIQSGGSASAANAFMTLEGVPANAHVDVDLPLLGAGGFFQALAGATTSITVLCLGGVIFSN